MTLFAFSLQTLNATLILLLEASRGHSELNAKTVLHRGHEVSNLFCLSVNYHTINKMHLAYAQLFTASVEKTKMYQRI